MTSALPPLGVHARRACGTVTITPQRQLPPSQQLLLNVDGGLRSVDDQLLETPARLRFRTERCGFIAAPSAADATFKPKTLGVVTP